MYMKDAKYLLQTYASQKSLKYLKRQIEVLLRYLSKYFDINIWTVNYLSLQFFVHLQRFGKFGKAWYNIGNNSVQTRNNHFKSYA